MSPVLMMALLFGGSRDSWISFALGLAAGLAFVLISMRLRRRRGR
ncbi:MAG TPA: hypothetical protein VFW30_10250 [Bryocella sp.]|nr:hypothetical protein [Bryocella sp.]